MKPICIVTDNEAAIDAYHLGAAHQDCADVKLANAAGKLLSAIADYSDALQRHDAECDKRKIRIAEAISARENHHHV